MAYPEIPFKKGQAVMFKNTGFDCWLD